MHALTSIIVANLVFLEIIHCFTRLIYNHLQTYLLILTEELLPSIQAFQFLLKVFFASWPKLSTTVRLAQKKQLFMHENETG